MGHHFGFPVLLGMESPDTRSLKGQSAAIQNTGTIEAEIPPSFMVSIFP